MSVDERARAQRSASLRRAALDPRAPVAALVAACVAAFALILVLGRHIGFYFDEWDFIVGRGGHSADTFLRPHNEHISVVPVAIYKVLFAVVGLGHHQPYLAVLALMQVALAVGVFVLARRRAGGWVALGVAVLVLFMGLAWQNIMWAFQIGFVGSVLGGVWALVALDRRDARGDVLACVALLGATLSSSLGVPLAVGVAVELLVGRRVRALWVALVPLAVYIVWYLGYGVSTITKEGVVHAAPWAVSAASAAAGALFGLGSDWGHVLLVVLVIVLIWRGSLVAPSARLLGLLAAAISFWALTGAARSVFQPPVPPESSRYLTIGAVLLALVAVEAVRGLVVPPVALAYGGALVLVAVALGLPVLRDNAHALQGISSATEAELGAVQLAARSAPPGYRPDADSAPQISAGPYLAAVESYGSKAGDTPAELASDLSGDRRQADRVLQELTARLTPAAGARDCTPAPQPTAAVPVPRSGLVIRARGEQGVEVKLRRFGDEFSQPALGTVAPGKPMLLKLPADASPKPYVIQLASPSGFATCTP